jgi:hypothetical protein
LLLIEAYIRPSELSSEPHNALGHIASGPVVAASQSFIEHAVKGRYRKFLALEMESGGILAAIYEVTDPRKSLVLRGISDYGDGRKSQLDKIGAGSLRRYAVNNAMQFLWRLMEAGEIPFADNTIQEEKPVQLRISVSRLPNTGEYLIGRGQQLQQLNEAWDNANANIVQIVAPGGVGKTQLVKQWRQELVRRDFDEAVRVYDWSFYSQGTSNEAASADEYFDKAIRWFGEENSNDIRDPWQKGERLAELIRESRTLLILDGLEPLQHPPGPLSGVLTDPGLQALFKSLADRNSGLCIITTREAVQELESASEPTHHKINLSTLEPADGSLLLRKFGVKGEDNELE